MKLIVGLGEPPEVVITENAIPIAIADTDLILECLTRIVPHLL